MTDALALRFKQIVSRNIPSHKHPDIGLTNHNTPTPLRRRLHKKKFTGGHKVFFDERGDKYGKILPIIVEKGTEKSDYHQPNNPIFSKKPHPQNKPTNFWSKSMRQFRSDTKQVAREFERRIVFGRK